ncbi:Vegetative incompatibility HET-E-1 [Hyphodiscus hymeniophilus]|uniref:Vegetative incompatibility HET-E-1 n=1 Tax=Hyphodiscus hymeniophilus TaxID=353542 RepID=A0A9P7AY49_9HELO|nr:Vegetative incompatibility HET-E-1 [Hyphodiscus hymeniophilus]
MRLLKCGPDGEFSFAEFFDECTTPEYAILSHTWGLEEVTFKDFASGIGKDKTGYNKIRFCAQQAAHDSLQYFWVDTCCIDKSSSTELQEAINSMFRWYRNAVKCYVYLSDVSLPLLNTAIGFTKAWELSFRGSRWFTRGWTLQELIAPASVKFYSKDGQFLGDKVSLEQLIYETTNIPIRAFQGTPLSVFGIEERMAWAKPRQTKREEDTVYSLLGIFDVHMPLIYGERKVHALKRLYEEIRKSPKGPAILQADDQHLTSPAHSFDCNQCNKSFGSQSALAQHLSSLVHGVNCDKCNKSFGSQSALDQHLSSPAHELNCNKCRKSFGSQSAFDQHLTSPAHSFDCNQCNKSFGNQSALDQHLSSPAHELDCNQCNKSFSSQSALAQHLSSPAHDLNCNKCNKYFGSQIALAQHLMSPTHGFVQRRRSSGR